MKLIVVNNYEELSKVAAKEFSKIIKEKENAVLGLATGGSPVGMYKELIRMYEQKELKEIEKVTLKIKLIVIAFGGFAVLAAFLIGPEFLGLVYGLDLTAYRMNLCVIIGSYIFYAISYINLVTLTTIRHTFIQFVIYVASMVIAYIGSTVLVQNFGINGATFSCTTTLAIQFVLYTIATKVIMHKESKKINS